LRRPATTARRKRGSGVTASSTRQFRVLLDHAGNDPVLERFVSAHPVVALHIQTHSLDWRARLLRNDACNPSRVRRISFAWIAISVDCRLGDIEQLPVDDPSIDVIMSNCVINWATTATCCDPPSLHCS
jgi:hypothetical protein